MLDATLADLGAGTDWSRIHRARPRVALSCRACGGSMHAKLSPRGSRFFAHDVARSDCPLNGETPDHRLLKSAVAAAVRAAGWHATLEATGPGRRWRADVLATSPDGSRQVAWEAQLAPQHDDDTRARTDRYTRDGVEAVWIFQRPTRGDVPAVTVAVDQTSIRVAGPIARLVVETCAEAPCHRYRDRRPAPPCPGHGRWEPVTLDLDTFVGLVCRDEVVRAPLEVAGVDTTSWTSPVYLRRADAVRAAQESADASVADDRARRRQRREQQLRMQRAEAERHRARREALRERQQRLQPLVLRTVTEEAGAGQPAAGPWTLDGDHEHAMGVSIVAAGRVVAVICPVASRVTAEIADRLAEVTVYVASEDERRMLARRCRGDQRFVVVSDPTG